MPKYCFLILSLLALAACNESSAKETKNSSRSISVMGECLRKVSPDRASVKLQVSNLRSTSQAAASETQRVYMDLAAKLKEESFDISAAGYRVFEDFSWAKSEKQSLGWRAIMGLEVSSSDLAGVGRAVGIARNFSNVEAENFTISVSPELLKKEKDACLQSAVKDAQSKAEAMLKELGKNLGEVLTVRENRTDFHRPVPYPTTLMADMGGAGGAFSEVDSRPQDLAVEVEVRFDIK